MTAVAASAGRSGTLLGLPAFGLDPVSADLDNFVPIDWDAPLDASAALAAVPDHVTVKGMFVKRMIDDAARAGFDMGARRPYRSFKDYPMRELMDAQLLAARTVFRQLTLREAMRRLGRTAFPTLMESMIGRVIFAPAGNDVVAAFRLASRGYRVSISDAEVSVRRGDDDRSLVVSYGQIYNFLDSYQVGVVEGAVLHYGHEPRTQIRRHSEHAADVLVRWT